MPASNITPHDCIHEEQILGQSRIIERLDAELGYKKQRLDEIKEDNRRMETKIDDIKDCINQLIVKSNANDSVLEARLIAIETKQEDLEEKVDGIKKDFEKKFDDYKKDNETKTNQNYTKMALLVSGISAIIGIIFQFI